ncbi:MAG: DUF1559 domain-containing protein, partial [Planctomycetes bacterium]|nr:DUF1559 domain-containing protein [Planctomycetota bacterium]
FLDVQAFLQAVAGEMSDEDRKTVTDLGVDGIEWAGATATCDPPGFRNRFFISCPGERTGLLALVPSQPVSEDIFEFAPKTSIVAVAVRLDAGEFYDRLRRLVGVLSEDEGAEFDEDMAHFREEFGFDLRDDLLAPLGDEFLIYVAPTPLSPFGLDVAVLVRGTDGERLKVTFEALADLLRQRFGEAGPAQVQALDVEGHALYSLRLGPTGPPFAPSFGVTDTCAVASLYPGSAQGLMRAAVAGKRPTELSLLVSENFKAAREKVSASGLMVSYADVAEYFNVTYRGIMTVLTMRGQELPFDPMLLPQPETISKHLGGSMSVVSVDEDGFLIEQYSPTIIHAGFSPETTGVVAAAMLPALARAREAARKAVCKSNLKQIGLALAIYANDHDDKYPLRLEDLLVGYLPDAEVLQCPSDSSEERSYLYVPGLSVAHEATLMVVVERRGNHTGGRNVLFVDSHVEWMSEEVFQIRWAEQRQKYDLPSLKELGDRIEEE